MDLEEFRQKSRSKARENKKFLNSLKKQNPRLIDDAFHEKHDEVFEEIDCLTCANCCKTTSPIFTDRDIDRIASYLGIKPGDFVQEYLKIDEDEDYVLKSSPCTFLMPDNTCSIYEARPRACREYPHTDRKRMVSIMDLTYKNTMVCPAVFEIINRLKNLGV